MREKFKRKMVRDQGWRNDNVMREKGQKKSDGSEEHRDEIKAVINFNLGEIVPTHWWNAALHIICTQ